MRCSAVEIERGDAQLHDEVDRADVDAEFERCGGDDRAQFAVLEEVLGVEAYFLARLP